ncbi:hypothetical protein AXF42_Ash004762 [Apostasia shenzhenica]|uniref:Uncharacterized protein n=1 Tax=Apostasia shenzhenica TaxID=1088818 RepID=A0A2I0BHK4_9ASPA|nr:hypothetical protein AXF42_Ash004762 [Apostasia shenzhenica]
MDRNKFKRGWLSCIITSRRNSKHSKSMAASHLLPVLLLGTAVAALMTSAQPIIPFYSRPFSPVSRNDANFGFAIGVALRQYNSFAYDHSLKIFVLSSAIGVFRRVMVEAVPAVVPAAVPAVVPYIYRAVINYRVVLYGSLRYAGQQGVGSPVSLRISFAVLGDQLQYFANIIPGTFSARLL